MLAVLEVDEALVEHRLRMHRLVLHFEDAVGDRVDEGVGARAGAVRAHEDAVARLRHVEDGREADRRGTGIGVA